MKFGGKVTQIERIKTLNPLSLGLYLILFSCGRSMYDDFLIPYTYIKHEIAQSLYANHGIKTLDHNQNEFKYIADIRCPVQDYIIGFINVRVPLEV